jgi:poly(beta-D-mannuronate) lyase
MKRILPFIIKVALLLAVLLTGCASAAVRPVSSPTAAARVPAALLDLTNWKVTLPVDAVGETTGRATEVTQPHLASFAREPYFMVRSDGGVRFRAPTSGATTQGSTYPRSELREMTDGGTKLASWSTSEGRHSMTIEQAITVVPATKRHVVAGQIHDGSDDVITIRLEQPRLFVDHNGVDGRTLTSSYVLGTRFSVRFEASDGQIRVYYNGGQTPSDTLARAGGGMYFKAGAYTQSNCVRETATPCGESNFGEVVIYALHVLHQ